MRRYKVLKNGQDVGTVEAMTTVDAVDAAQRDFGIRIPQDLLKLERDTLSMHILIDTTNSRAIARHDSYQALAALAVIQFANVDTAIVRMGENRTFAVFDPEQLASIGASVGIEIDPASSYGEKIRKLRAALESFEHLNLPFTTEDLERQAFGIASGDDKPYAFDPSGSKPKPMAKWHFDPQRNRKRIDSSFGHCFSAGLGYGNGVVPPPPAATSAAADAKRPSAPAAPRPKPGATPAAPKPPKAPSEPATRPKPGTSTGKVWDAADAALAANPGAPVKELKSLVVAACEAEGINAGTAGVQFGKWKSSKGL